ncbi:MAG: type II secretion system protein GspG [Phycisphaerales bacterium]|nr:type II secretion system protein GspG [Phycisphaerales bacterium]
MRHMWSLGSNPVRTMFSAGLIAAWCCGAAGAQPADAQPAEQSNQSQPSVSRPRHLRLSEEKGRSLALQIATTAFKRPDGAGPTIALVGVAHIADRSFYRAVQDILDQHQLVLYESVKPPGTSGAGGETHQERLESTKAAMRFLGSVIEAHRAQTHEYPPNLEALRAFAAAENPRLTKFLEAAIRDAWGNQFVYLPEAKAEAHPPEGEAAQPAFQLISLGSDGQPAGEGEAQDIHFDETPSPDLLSHDDNLQQQLADALGLEFQLQALSYEKDNWRCSDMAMDVLSRRLQDKGIDFDVVGGTLAGSSLPAQIIKLLLGLIRFADSFLDGAIADTFKVVMIEMLADETVMDQALEQLGPGFGEVIVNDRNQIVIDDLKKVIEREPDIKSVAVLYGAAHMPDLTERLCSQLGYAAADEQQWVTAIEVDFRRSAVSANEIDRIRAMVRQMMRQQMRRN